MHFLDFKLKSFSFNTIFWELKAFIVLSLGDEKDQGTCSSSRWLKLDCLKLFCISDVTQFLWHCYFSQNNISSNDVWSNAYEHDISLNTIGISTNKLEKLNEIETGMMDGLRGYERC